MESQTSSRGVVARVTTLNSGGFPKGVECEGGHLEGNFVRVAIINDYGIVWINHEVFELNNDFQIDDAYELFTNQGMVHIITTGLSSHLKLYQVVNQTIQYVQDLPVQPFEAHPHLNFIGTGSKDFVAIPALLRKIHISYFILGSSTLVNSSSISFLGMYKGNGVTTSFWSSLYSTKLIGSILPSMDLSSETADSGKIVEV